MALINFKFIKSASKRSEFLNSVLPQIAVVGRSNVGKSSLINLLANNKKMAKTSSTPGRTRLVNYFNVNNEFLLVDLPGYGYAAASKSEKDNWDKMLDDYFEANTSYIADDNGELVLDREKSKLKLVLVLIDSRREPTNLDMFMCEYLSLREIPFIVAMTKSDKLSRTDLNNSKNRVSKMLKLNLDRIVVTSANKKIGSAELENLIKSKL